ncbi:MAG TPA: CpXC domain-containing protein [Rhodopila sp.]|uniref:CpXC domain-containing protein n=1 Tax=Rhodopila sp. TaxID=2480087 RepID=UPI002C0B179A|nr:CpXC domain-containing protein [Rhodopila sp.]HVY14287.1 CpXC domain-containing protein [Rhodopila sp.]
MSLFQDVATQCPACKVALSYEMVHSVNADRRPDLRDAILDSSFQVLTCESCGENFRIEPQFTYVHMAGKQFLTVWPVSRIDDWVAMEKRGDDSYLSFYGPNTSEAAQQIGRELTRRTVFGWAALREKIVSAAAGIDDVTLELAKIAMLRWAEGLEAAYDVEMRLLGIGDDGNLVFGTYAPGEEVLKDVITVPKDLLSEIEADAESWQPLRERLTEGSFVDAQRLQMATEPA